MVKQEQLEQTKLFGDLKSFEWQELMKITNEREFVDGDIVFSEGDASTEFYMLFKVILIISNKLFEKIFLM